MIDSIKKLFSGILSFFIGLFGGKKAGQDKPNLKAGEPAANVKKKKRSGYFMELDEDEDIKPIAAAAKTLEIAKDNAAKTLETAKDSATKTLETAKDSATKTLEKVAAVIPTQDDAKTPEPVAAAQNGKNRTAKTSAPDAKAQAAAAKVELVQTAEGVKAQPVKREKTPVEIPTEKTFAPKYLMPQNSNSRRRPGPSMNNFLDMARQVKTPG